MARTSYSVRYGKEVARFTNYKDAMAFAEAKSRGGHLIEVGHKTGLVGQYRNGVTTPEFELHHATLVNH